MKKYYFQNPDIRLNFKKHNVEKLTFLNLSWSLWNICAFFAMDFRKFFLAISVFRTEPIFQIFISNGHNLA